MKRVDLYTEELMREKQALKREENPCCGKAPVVTCQATKLHNKTTESIEATTSYHAARGLFKSSPPFSLFSTGEFSP